MKRSAAPFRLELPPSSRSRWWRAGAAGATALSLVLALMAHFPAFWPLLLLPLLLLPLVAAWSAWAGRGDGPRFLRWDGQTWHLHAVATRGAAPSHWAEEEAAPVRLEILFDLGFWMLLRASPAPLRPWPTWGACAYLPLRRSNHLGNWTPLRAVLYGSSPNLD